MAKSKINPKFHTELEPPSGEERALHRAQVIRASESPDGKIQSTAEDVMSKGYQIRMNASLKSKLDKVAAYQSLRHKKTSIQNIVLGILAPAIETLYADIPEEYR